MNKFNLTFPFIALFLIALLVSFVSTATLIKLGKILQIVDVPNERKIHKQLTPRIGGLSFYLSFFASCLFILFFMPRFWNDKFLFVFSGLTLTAILGSFDDIKGISPHQKLLSQILIGLLMYYLGFRIERITNPFSGQVIQLNEMFKGVIPPIITILWYAIILNAINIIDGLDGLAAGVTCISSLSLFFLSIFMKKTDYVITMSTLIIIGTTLGFLKFNYYPAKIFMGDIGSLQLGFLLATIGLISETKGQTTIALLAPIIILGIPIFDTALAIVRRVINKKRIFVADRKHLHHRLLDLGLSQRQVVNLIYFICIYLGIISFVLANLPAKHILLMLIILTMGLFLGLESLNFIEKTLLQREIKNSKEKEQRNK